MLFIFGLGFGGVVLATCIGLASVVVKAYSCAPQPLMNTLRHLFDFLFSLTEVCCKLAAIVLLFLYNVITHFFGCFLGVVPGIYHLLSTIISLLLWISVLLIRGLLGLEAKALNTLSWLIAICFLFLYMEKNFQDLGITLFIRRRSNLARLLIGSRYRNIEIANIVNDNDVAVVNEDFNVDQGQQQENQQLEIENRENENEENALEEADRNRVNIDNVQNDQREMDRDRGDVVQTAHHIAEDDSSDDEIDPMMCSVCLNRARGAALFPCGHTHLCRICARIIIAAQRPCPICQTPIQEFRNIFV